MGTSTTIRVSVATRDQVNELAEVAGLSPSDYLERLVTQAARAAELRRELRDQMEQIDPVEYQASLVETDGEAHELVGERAVAELAALDEMGDLGLAYPSGHVEDLRADWDGRP